ncbi:MAG TPA: MFS transporter [Acidimicrobiales bacterium]|nr:MFS transporter [Acidimicrobiales bacterium]
MPRFTVCRTVGREEADRLVVPRDDIVAERREPADGDAAASGDGAGSSGSHGAARLVLDQGPFSRYERTVTTAPSGDDGLMTVTQDFDYHLPPGTWPFLMNWPFRAALRSPPAKGKLPWWYPPQRPDARGATVLGLLATLSLIVGYHGTLLTQTMTFAADEFGAGTAAQGDALAAVRIGGIIAIGLGAMADRRGRRLILSAALLVCIASTVAGALVPNLVALAATQAVNRGAWAAASLLLAIIAAEEMPAGARAYALSLLSMTGALGAGVALWLLPLADLSDSSWRVLYVVPVLFVPVVARFGRLIPESRRFTRPHRNVGLAGHYWRLALVAGSGFLLNVFMAPQSQFRNEFLRDERGMSAAVISLFVITTSTPAGIGIFAGGHLADTRGRRVVGATGISVGTVLIAASYIVQGPAMWVCALVGGIFAAALVPTITVYGPELFPTSLRGRANGLVSTAAMAGSVVGLSAFGRLETATGAFGRALAVLAVAPLVMAAVVLAFFPETARRELEDLNPEDRDAAPATTVETLTPG